jgi:ribosome-binding protein aMBF1 (putative translation factor)
VTAQEFRAALAHLGMQQSWLAAELGLNVSTVNRWAKGSLAVPRYIEAWLGLLAHPNERGEVLDDARGHTSTSTARRIQRLAKGRAKRRQIGGKV